MTKRNLVILYGDNQRKSITAGSFGLEDGALAVFEDQQAVITKELFAPGVWAHVAWEDA
ncbi:hypothetical protein KRX51_03215 [Corynebacterium sp. TAE3-ERU12]|uniref:hypothetical protein n=1 Tax=Corynebacterium sp. TAE3-ERU12 TaxID=2849491 RepID=UPI001C47443D|nr:hypothetical protein [Corynebacterium sp. TAE3-ERU12]MBV7294928.1 hypothetical protein [Corynebacterium sp. TAE3-ERU12]